MTVPTVTGQTLVDMANDLLAGYQNAVDSRALLTYLNMGKDVIWEVTKELHEEYFQVFSQSTNPTGEFYFPQLSTATRNYTLPADLRSIEFIECTTPSFQGSTFTYAKLNSPAFREERKASNEMGGPDPNNNVDTYTYTIAGKNQFVLAAYPATNLTLILWYTRALPDFETSDVLDEILFPFSKKLAEYAAQKAMLGAQDAGQFAMWERTWRDSLINLVQSEGTRNDADPQFVQDFLGDDE
jgi:hypothetical protein